MEKPSESGEKISDVLVQETPSNEAVDNSGKVEEIVEDSVQADLNKSTQEKAEEKETESDNGRQCEYGIFNMYNLYKDLCSRIEYSS